MNPTEIEIRKVHSIVLPNNGLRRLFSDFRLSSISESLARQTEFEEEVGGGGGETPVHRTGSGLSWLSLNVKVP